MVIPICYAWKRGSGMSYRQIVEWSILSTFDRYASRIDQPQSLEQVRAWFARAELTRVTVKLGPNGINGRATRAM